jgi:hypothetical protein
MNSVSKVLIPNKEWLIKGKKEKIGTVAKIKKNYVFLHKGQHVVIGDLKDVETQLGVALFDGPIKNIPLEKNHNIYDFPCRSKPYNPVYSVKKRLPLFSKSSKSKSQYCAGYYIIFRKKGWATSFCPKLITIERYKYYGPFKTEAQMKEMLNKVDKYETT